MAPYRAKRRSILHQKANLVEIDLLTVGRRMETSPKIPLADCYAIVSRGIRPNEREVFSSSIRRVLPRIPIPLKPSDLTSFWS